MNTPPPQSMTAPMTPPKTSGLAITSLVLGCLSIFGICFTGIPAIICGHVALSKIKKSAGTIGGFGMGLAGLILGYLMTALSVIWIGLAVPVAMKALDKANQVTVINNARSIKASLDLYAGSNSGNYPSTLNDLVPTVFPDQASLDALTLVKLESGKTGTLTYVPGSTQTSPSHLIILYSPETKSAKRIIVRLDSSVRSADAAKAKADLAKQGITVP